MGKMKNFFLFFYLNCFLALIYSIGIANEWEFDDGVAALNADVYSFDPTTPFLRKHEEHAASAPAIRFFFQGLAGDALPGEADSLYGSLGGKMLTLPQMMQQFNHTYIDILKIDVKEKKKKKKKRNFSFLFFIFFF